MSRKNQYPRPQFVRSQWKNLNGTWEFAFDDADRGIEEKWYETGNIWTDRFRFLLSISVSLVESMTRHLMILSGIKSDFLWKSQKKERSFSFILRQLTTKQWCM